VPRRRTVAWGAAVPCPTKWKATNSSLDQTEPSKKVMPRQKQASQKPKDSKWVTPNKYAYQPKAHAPQKSLSSCFVLKCNDLGKVVAKYVGMDTNKYVNTSIWVPKILVTNM